MDEHIKENESVENLWLERSILITDECTNKFETNLTQFEEVKNIHKILLNPLRNAINDINEKTKELKQFIAHFKSNGSLGLSYSSQIHNLQPLTMRLLGCLDARVNGGLIKYVKELFTQNLIESKSFNSVQNRFLAFFLILCVKIRVNFYILIKTTVRTILIKKLCKI